MNAAAPKKSWVFWVLLALGGGCTFCSLGTLGVVALGAMDDGAPAKAPEQTGGEWIPAGEVARGTVLTEALPGGRWVYQSGSQLDSVQARTANSVLVQTSTMGALHDLRFSNEGTYQWQWVHSSNFQGQYRSSAEELGTWTLDGRRLTLVPTEQKARYSNRDQVQEKEDVDLRPRTYELVDITLETVPHTGAPMRRFAGIELSGPNPVWSIDQGTLRLDLQRL